jgi:hypothetical protein
LNDSSQPTRRINESASEISDIEVPKKYKTRKIYISPVEMKSKVKIEIEISLQSGGKTTRRKKKIIHTHTTTTFIEIVESKSLSHPI